MAKEKTESGKLAVEYIQKYGGQLSKRSVATLLAQERPDLFKTVEAARYLIRYHTGNNGKKSRRNKEQNTFFCRHPEPQPTDYFFDLAKENSKILLLSDIHVPFQDKAALDLAVNYGVKKGVDTVILNGDTFDHYAESSHQKSYNKNDPEEDFEQYQDFLFELRCAFPDATIIFKKGNHEKRWERWFIQNGMGKLLAINQFEYSKIMNFDEYKIQLVEDYTTITVAGLNIIHGHEYNGSGGVNPARWLSLRTGESTICGHFHRSSGHTERSHRGDITSYWSTGHLSIERPQYMAYNNWNHGFAMIIKEGKFFHVKNKQIHEGMIL